MKATEALEISKENDLDSKQLDEIILKIQSEAKKGAYCIFFQNLRDENLLSLSDLGYTTELVAIREGSVSVKISWKYVKPTLR